MIKKLIINKFILKVLSLIGWIIVGGMHGLCRLVNKIYGVFGGFLTVMLVILFLIVSIGYKDVQQSIFLAVLESLNILVMIAGNTLEIVLELACDRLAYNLVQMLDRVKEALREDVVQKDIVPDGDHVAMTDRINRYMVASRKMLKRAMIETCQLAAFIYHECFVLEVPVEELKQKFPGYEDYIDVTVCYIQQLIDRSKEKH